MRTSTTLAGVLFGALLAGALVVPLYVTLPARYLDWYYVPEQAGLFAVVAALALWCAAGFVGAATHPEDAVRSGTGAGVLASLVASALMVQPAAAVEGCAELVIQIQSAPFGVRPQALADLLGETMVRAMWLPSTGALGMLLTGPALGAVGGVLYDLWRGIPYGQNREVYRSSVPLTGLVMTCGAFAILLSVLKLLEGTYLPAVGAELDFLERAQLTAPVAIVALLATGFGWWVIRDATVMWRAGFRIAAAVWVFAGAVAYPVLLTEALVLHPTVLLTPGAWIGILGTGIGLVGGLAVCIRGDEELPSVPRGFGDLLGEGLMHGVVVAAVPTLVGGSSAAALYVFARPYVDALRAGTTEVTALPAEAGLNVVMQGHWLLALVIVGVTVVYLVPAIPLMLASRVRARAE